MNTDENAPQSRQIEAQSCHIMNNEPTQDALQVMLDDAMRQKSQFFKEARDAESQLVEARKRLIDAEEILGELASGYWRQTLNNIDDRPTRPDWPMGELIQLYWEKHK